MLSFGHRLGLLREVWGFPINQDLADALSGAKKDGTAEKGRLHYTTVYRWAEKGTEPRDHSLGGLSSALSEFLDAEGYLKKFEVEKDDLNRVMISDDLAFIRFLAGTGQKALPVPVGARKMKDDDVQFVAQKYGGRYFMYRLGSEAIKKGPMTVGVRYALKRIPCEILKDGAHLAYREKFFDYSASGYVFYIMSYITIFGEDADREGRSELFLVHIDTRDPERDGLLNGILSMEGDLGAPTAYRILIRRAPPEANDLPWEDFVCQNQRSIALTDDLLPMDEKEESPGKPYKDYIDLLDLREKRIDLQI